MMFLHSNYLLMLNMYRLHDVKVCSPFWEFKELNIACEGDYVTFLKNSKHTISQMNIHRGLVLQTYDVYDYLVANVS